MTFVFAFGATAVCNDPRSRDKTVVGGKGANLAEMAGIGLPVPPGFTITTEECVRYLAEGGEFSDDLKAEVAVALGHIEATVGKTFGNPADPLLVSVRSGARVSMPGMMDTVLNIGLNGRVTLTNGASTIDSSINRDLQDNLFRATNTSTDYVLNVGKPSDNTFIQLRIANVNAADKTPLRLVSATAGRSLLDQPDQLSTVDFSCTF